MKTLISLTAALLCAAAAWGQQATPVAELNWKELAPTNLPAGTIRISRDGRDALKIDNTNATSLRVTLWTLNKPGISATVYGLRGEVRYDAVRGDGYLEMLNYFDGHPGPAFSRTLAEVGDLQKLSGTSDWRPFFLPFDSTDAPGKPAKLTVSLVLPRQGTVFIGPIKLVQYSSMKSLVDYRSGAWWSLNAGNELGGWTGAGIGCLGALIGLLSARGKARALVTGLLKVLILAGVVFGGSGIVALAQHQPYAVWYPLILLGVILLAVCPVMLFKTARRYEELELRRMHSIDAAG